MSFDVIGINHFLLLSALVFSIGVFGLFYNRRNLIVMFMSVELLLLATQINLVAFSNYNGDVSGQILSIFVMGVAIAEVVIGLALLVSLFRVKGSIDIKDINILKG